MTRIDFYLLQDTAVPAMHRFACALAAKAIQTGTQVFVRAPDPAVISELDELMWAYPEERFVPHTTSIAEAGRAPVIIHPEPPRQVSGLMINLGPDVAPFFGRFDRVAEIVVGEQKEAGRARYKHYRDRGCPLYHHELDDWETK